MSQIKFMSQMVVPVLRGCESVISRTSPECINLGDSSWGPRALLRGTVAQLVVQALDDGIVHEAFEFGFVEVGAE